MPYDPRIVGQQTTPVEHEVDARWLMAYAAGIGDCSPSYMETASGTVIGHPLFPVCLEWPVNLSIRELQYAGALTPEEAARGVHATHDLHIFKPIVAGETYTTQACVVGLQAIKPGAAQTLKLVTCDSQGELVCTTWQTGISRGVEIAGDNTIEEPAPEVPEPPDAAGVVSSFEVSVAEGAANVYTETARIFNPIHSDKAYAMAAGLPDIILHGTATLALGITELVNGCLGGDSRRITRLGGRFTGMVLMPNTLTTEVLAEEEGVLHFVIRDSDGQIVFNQGFLCHQGPAS